MKRFSMKRGGAVVGFPENQVKFMESQGWVKDGGVTELEAPQSSYAEEDEAKPNEEVQPETAGAVPPVVKPEPSAVSPAASGAANSNVKPNAGVTSNG